MQFIFGIVPPLDLSKSIQDAFPGQLAETHITVKAQCGLTPEIDNWFPNVAHAIKAFGSFTVQVGGPATFGDDVLYLSIESSRIRPLHDLLMDTIKPATDDAKKYFELDNWTPHLTLSMGEDSLSESNLALAASLPSPVNFQANEIWLFRQKNDGDPYVKYRNVSLL